MHWNNLKNVVVAVDMGKVFFLNHNLPQPLPSCCKTTIPIMPWPHALRECRNGVVLAQLVGEHRIIPYRTSAFHSYGIQHINKLIFPSDDSGYGIMGSIHLQKSEILCLLVGDREVVQVFDESCR